MGRAWRSHFHPARSSQVFSEAPLLLIQSFFPISSPQRSGGRQTLDASILAPGRGMMPVPLNSCSRSLMRAEKSARRGQHAFGCRPRPSKGRRRRRSQDDGSATYSKCRQVGRTRLTGKRPVEATHRNSCGDEQHAVVSQKKKYCSYAVTFGIKSQ